VRKKVGFNVASDKMAEEAAYEINGILKLDTNRESGSAKEDGAGPTKINAGQKVTNNSYNFFFHIQKL
jgi:hypothetical protein